MKITNSEVVVNEQSQDLDFRVESNNYSHALFVDAGNDVVGVGTSSPNSTYTFAVSGVNVSKKGIRIDTDGDTTQLSIGGNGNVEVDAPGVAGGRFLIDHDGSTIINEAGNGDYDFRVESDNKSHAIFVDASSYDVFFGISSTSYPTNANFVHINEQSGATMVVGGHSGTHTVIQFRHNGATTVGSIVVNGSSTSYNTSSDYRLKENVVAMTGATTRLKQLEPKRFNFIADEDDTIVDGFIAHEVQSVVPEAITGTHNEVDADGNPVYQGIDQSKLVPLLVATIKELEARITALENA